MCPMKYWLLKSEPEAYSIDHMAKDKRSLWENVRNYQARNFMVKDMKIGDLALFYHSNAKPPGVVGLVEITAVNQIDNSQFDKKSEYFEPRATRQKPVWFCAEVSFKEKFKGLISLDELRTFKNLSKMLLLNKSRLSVQPVAESEFKFICQLAEKN